MAESIVKIHVSRAVAKQVVKVIGALKRKRIIPRHVSLKFSGGPATAKTAKRKNPRKRVTIVRRAKTVIINGTRRKPNTTYESFCRQGRKRSKRKQPKKNVGGFMSGGVFHPIRSGERLTTYRGKPVLVKDDVPYSRRRAGEKPLRKRR